MRDRSPTSLEVKSSSIRLAAVTGVPTQKSDLEVDCHERKATKEACLSSPRAETLIAFDPVAWYLRKLQLGPGEAATANSVSPCAQYSWKEVGRKKRHTKR